MHHPSRNHVIVLSLLTLVVAPLAASAQGSIEGTVTFWGDPGGGTQIHVAAMPEPWTDPTASVVVGLNDPFTLSVPDGSYYVWAYLDRDGGFGDAEEDDVVVLYDGDADGAWDAVTVSGAPATGIDIDLGFVYVDIDAVGANDGSSWADAFTNLQDGIDVAVSGIEVWTAEGTYVPGASRSDSFLPKPGVRVYGGFVGTETLRPQRDWNGHPTILSGEIGTAAATDNCYHVVRADNANAYAVLDGVTVTRGYADGGGGDSHGGGIRAVGGGLTIANSVISDNYAGGYGGGIYTETPATVVAANSSFVGNQALVHGGGFYLDANTGTPSQAFGCVFTGNSAWRGGGLAVEGQIFTPGLEPTLVNLSLSGNTAGGEGGGIFANTTTFNPPGGAPVHIENTIVWSNSGTNPEISVFGGSDIPVVNYSLVQGGWAGPGTHIIDVDPSFADADLRLNLDSPAIDAGDNNAVPIDDHDVDGNHWNDEPIKRDRDFNQRFRNLPYIPNTGNSAPDEWPVDVGAYEAWDPTLIFEHDFESGDLDPWSATSG